VIAGKVVCGNDEMIAGTNEKICRKRLWELRIRKNMNPEKILV
jgi:hypothetical protein